MEFSQDRYIVKLRDLSVSREDKEILKDVNYQHTYGEFSYIIGETGSGKSSLLEALYGEAQISSGTATIDGVVVNGLVGDELALYRRKLGMVFQHMQLFDDWTVKENLDFVLRATDWTIEEKRKARINEVLDHVSMKDKGNETLHQLSGGQKQKLALARAILNKPSLILADEPTGYLDPKSTDEVMYLLRDLAKEYEAAIIFATHNQRIIDKFPARVYRCADGQLIEV